MKLSQKKQNLIDREIEKISKNLENLDPVKDEEEYNKNMIALEKLYSAKELLSKSKVKPDTIALILGNVGVTLLVLHYEKIGVITSKALSFIFKGRV